MTRTAISALFPPQWAMIAPMLVILSVQAAVVLLAWTLQEFYKAMSRTGFVICEPGQGGRVAGRGW